MKLIAINWSPTNRQLRQFACIAFAVLPLVGWFSGAGLEFVGLLALVGLFLAIGGMARPAAVKPIFLAATIVTTPIGMIIGELAMLLIYFGVFVPFGLAFRVGRRDALQLVLDRRASTYWQPKKGASGAASYYRQF